MELNKRIKSSKERGTSLIELMIACLVLMIGVMGVVSLIPIAIAENGRNRQQSNSTVIAQMVMEKLMSVPAGTTTVLTISDCTPTAFNVSTTGGGAPLLGSGDVNFSAAAPAGYSMNYTACGPAGGAQSIYDVRWNIQTPSTFVKLITVSAKLKGSGNNATIFSLPVTIRSMAGQGS